MSSFVTEKSTDCARKHNPAKEMIGFCLRCGHRITLCGLPFTADIKCTKCLYINVFRDSQQPVSGRG